jgi:hypothetical protein
VHKSILHDWVMDLPLRHQGVLLTGIRGCDGVPKHDLSKPVMRAIRFFVLINYDMRETICETGFTYWDPKAFREGVEILAKNLDEYPVHFVFHMLHALEVIGYHFPVGAFIHEPEYAERLTKDGHGLAQAEDYCGTLFRWAYEKLVRKFHLNSETYDQLQARLHEDRVADKTVGL